MGIFTDRQPINLAFEAAGVPHNKAVGVSEKTGEVLVFDEDGWCTDNFSPDDARAFAATLVDSANVSDLLSVSR